MSSKKPSKDSESAKQPRTIVATKFPGLAPENQRPTPARPQDESAGNTETKAGTTSSPEPEPEKAQQSSLRGRPQQPRKGRGSVALHEAKKAQISRAEKKKPKQRNTSVTEEKSGEELDTFPKDSSATVVEFPGEDAEERAARLRKKRTTWIVVAASGLLVLITVGLVFYLSPVLAIKEIKVDGTSLITEQTALQALDPLMDRPLPQASEKRVLEHFSGLAAVKSVTTRAEPPHTLVVEVEEHVPVAMSPRGEKYVVFSSSADEIAQISKKQAQGYDLPVVASAEDVADPKLFNTITQVLGALPDDLREKVTKASGVSIDSIELTLTNGKTVLWGNAEDNEEKVQVLQALLGMSAKQSKGIKEYDVSTPHHPVTR